MPLTVENGTFSFNGKPKAAAFCGSAFEHAEKRSRLRLAVKRAIAIREKYISMHE